jgi:hypothetical protein
MGRSLLRVSLIAMVASFGLAPPVLLTAGGGVAAAANPDCGATGVITTSGTTVSLNEDCSTTTPLTPVPNGFTFEGNNHTISFSDPASGPNGPHFSGAVIQNAGASMNVQDVTIDGPPNGLAVPMDCSLLLFGILFGPGNSSGSLPAPNAGGTVNNVHVNNVFQQHDGFGNCNIGHSIRANAFVAPAETVTITNSTVAGYQKGGLTASGAFMTMNASNNTIGPAAPLEGYIAPNAVQYGGGLASDGTGGTLGPNNTIFGTGDQAPTPPGNDSGGATDATAVLLYAANNVTVTHNTITGAKTDIGVMVAVDIFQTPNVPSTGITISNNQIGRTAPDVPDPTGRGINVCSSNAPELVAPCTADPLDAFSSATLICNTFSGWNQNIVGAIQVDCTPIPNGTCQTAYTATMPTVQGGMAPFTWSTPGPLPPGLALSPDGAISGTPTSTGTFAFTATVDDSTSPPFTATQDESITIGGTCGAPPDYRLVGQDGGVFVFGDSSFDGSLPGVPEYSKPIVGAAVTSTGNGYWMVGNDGSLFAFGDANFFGSLFGQRLAAPIVGMASPNDGGYWMAGADGGVFAFGDAPFLGSLVGTPLAAPIVGIASTPDGKGYWLVGADGGIFAFGDAGFFGSLPSSGIAPAAPIVGMSPTHDGKGYWLVAADGGVFAFGDAGFFGSAANLALVAPIVGIVPSPDDGGYWLMGADGGVFAYGDAPFLGSMVSLPHIGPLTSAIS